MVSAWMTRGRGEEEGWKRADENRTTFQQIHGRKSEGGVLVYFVRRRPLEEKNHPRLDALLHLNGSNQSCGSAPAESTLLQAAGSRDSQALLLCSCLPSNPEVSCCFGSAFARSTARNGTIRGPSASETSGDSRVCPWTRSTCIRGLASPPVMQEHTGEGIEPKLLPSPVDDLESPVPPRHGGEERTPPQFPFCQSRTGASFLFNCAYF